MSCPEMDEEDGEDEGSDEGGDSQSSGLHSHRVLNIVLIYAGEIMHRLLHLVEDA